MNLENISNQVIALTKTVGQFILNERNNNPKRHCFQKRKADKMEML